MTEVQRMSAGSVSERLGHLTTLSREQLIDLWIKHFGRGPPKAISTSLLLRAVSYTIQERSLGRLKTKDQKLLARLSGAENAPPDASDTSEGPLPVTGRASIDAHNIDIRQVCAGKNVPNTMSRPAPRCGTRLVRTWQGKSHIVDVGEEGFTWNGNVYGSLTKVAFTITGARWSGPRFFRL